MCVNICVYIHLYAQSLSSPKILNMPPNGDLPTITSLGSTPLKTNSLGKKSNLPTSPS